MSLLDPTALTALQAILQAHIEASVASGQADQRASLIEAGLADRARQLAERPGKESLIADLQAALAHLAVDAPTRPDVEGRIAQLQAEIAAIPTVLEVEAAVDAQLAASNESLSEAGDKVMGDLVVPILTHIEANLPESGSTPGGTSIPWVTSPVAEVNPDDAGRIDLYLPGAVTDSQGNQTLMHDMAGNRSASPLKVILDPAAGTGNGVLFSANHPLTTAQAALGTQAPLGSGESALYVVQRNLKTGRMHLLRTNGWSAPWTVLQNTSFGSSYTNLSTNGTNNYTACTICRYTNHRGGPVRLATATNFKYMTNGSTATLRPTLRLADGTDGRPGTLLATAAEFVLPDSAGTATVYSSTVTLDLDVPAGATAWLCFERMDANLDTTNCYIYTAVRVFDPFFDSNLYGGSYGLSSTGTWNNYPSYYFSADIAIQTQIHLPEPAQDGDNEYQNVLLIGQGGAMVEEDSTPTFVARPFEEVLRGTASVSAGEVPFAIVPTLKDQPITLPVQTVTSGSYIESLAGYAETVLLVSQYNSTYLYLMEPGRYDGQILRLINAGSYSFYLYGSSGGIFGPLSSKSISGRKWVLLRWIESTRTWEVIG